MSEPSFSYKFYDEWYISDNGEGGPIKHHGYYKIFYNNAPMGFFSKDIFKNIAADECFAIVIMLMENAKRISTDDVAKIEPVDGKLWSQSARYLASLQNKELTHFVHEMFLQFGDKEKIIALKNGVNELLENLDREEKEAGAENGVA